MIVNDKQNVFSVLSICITYNYIKINNAKIAFKNSKSFKCSEQNSSEYF